MAQVFSPAEQAAIEKAIAAVRVTKIDPPPPMDPDLLARYYAERERARAAKKPASGPLPQETIDEILEMIGLYTKQAIADRLEISLAAVNRVLKEEQDTGRRKVTDELRKGVLALKGKCGQANIASRFGIGQSTVSRIFQEAGLAGPAKTALTTEVVERVLALAGSMSRKAIATRVGVSLSSVRRIVLEHADELRERLAQSRPRKEPRTKHPGIGQGRAQKHVTPEQRAAILSLRDTLPASELARRFGFSSVTIRRVVRSHKGPAPQIAVRERRRLPV